MEVDCATIRIGVDVGVAVDLSLKGNAAHRGVLAHQKTTTTPDATTGITDAVKHVIESASISPSRVATVTIGTTHFMNAVIERDARRLRPVAIIRVSKSFLREIPPFAEWPADLARLIRGYVGYVDGGIHIDGREEASVIEEQVVQEATKIKELGLNTIVVAGVFSPIDQDFKQEDRIRDILLNEIPGADVVCSHTVANVGFMERENASILNAAILKYARKTVKAFHLAMRQLYLTCPIFITQNDGTGLSASSAAKTPIRTFCSGATNSMRGAAYLSGKNLDGLQSIVIDVGGTTTDVGVLLSSNVPRQAFAYVEIVPGVRVNYSLPHLHSIGLGGGCIVRHVDGKVTVGPDSVGKELEREALVFGGTTITATDIAVAAGMANIGDSSKVSHLDHFLVEEARKSMKKMFETAMDVMKLSPDPLPVLLVGGGAIIAPESLQGAASLTRPIFYDVANAVGAAISQISGCVDILQDTRTQSVQQAISHAKRLAIEKAKESGASENSIHITEVETMPVSYIEKRIRIIARAVGDVDTRVSFPQFQFEEDQDDDDIDDEPERFSQRLDDPILKSEEVNPLTYSPKVVYQNDRLEWVVSVTDVAYLADGCYVLGCAGGGSPAAVKIQLTRMLREGYIMRIIDPSALGTDDIIYSGGGLGSPAVGVERLQSTENVSAMKALMAYLGHDNFQAVMPIEIGGGNGLEPLLLGSSRFFNVPVVDGDWMGRAYPTAWQTTLAAHESHRLVPCAIDSGDGSTIIMTASSSDKLVDSILRAACVEMGSAVGAATRPTNKADVTKYAVLNTFSLAWRIGRSIARCNFSNTISSVAESIIEEAGGPGVAKILFRGKIIQVENELSQGHSYGVVHIKSFDHIEDEDQSSRPLMAAVAHGGLLKLPFKNEIITAEHEADDGEVKIIASVPDLIAVLDNGSGKALGVPEFRYGYRVTVIGITCSPRWVDTERAVEIGGPKAFGFANEYQPLGTYVQPKSVIEEYRPKKFAEE
ncbi:hypothetical protein BT63DRAFT_410929 [Microthyrium microscopicum]|uniref:DUF917-domain-containing protein n=1 Tax=Microthyrium microscopicum TaxID=703497 RepID=A0A6A6UNX4_9PEZI|nr:hypothetical protein BT63DRAFT_410929 [Microthyrium microscopicum]